MAAPMHGGKKIISSARRLIDSGFIQKFREYVVGIIKDYKSSTVNIFTDARDRPVKAAFYITSLSAVGYLCSTNPDENSFDEALVNASNDMLQVSDLVRNKGADFYLQNLLEMRNKTLLKRMNLGICSIIWRDNYGSSVGLYDSSCKHLKVTWGEFPSRIVDVGFHKRWWFIEKAMVDFDVNEEEFEGDMVKSTDRWTH